MALTHPSGVGVSGKQGPGASQKKGRELDFERLEFLGDRVLGLVIAHLLYQRYPAESEGDLAKRQASLVSRATCRLVAEHLKLQDLLKANKSDMTSRSSILADSLEALIGGIFLDGGLEEAQKFIENHWTLFWNQAEPPPRDAKTVLQEWAQGQGLLAPQYRLISIEGPAHEPLFHIEVVLQGRAVATPASRLPEDLQGMGAGRSKRLAEQEAAGHLLQLLKEKGMKVT